MQQNQTIHIWEGERKIINSGDRAGAVKLKCLSGCGAVRVMGEPHRHILVQGQSLQVDGQQIISLSANQDTSVLLSSSIQA
jgi:hypothetical protein